MGPDSVTLSHCFSLPGAHCFPQPIFCIFSIYGSTSTCLWKGRRKRLMTAWRRLHVSERICPSGGSIGQTWSNLGVGDRSFLWKQSLRNGGVLWESSAYFREASCRLSTGQEWDWHAPDACWHLTVKNMHQEFGFHSLLWFVASLF